MNKEDLEDGAYYTGRCRNAQVARWDASKSMFRHWRTKFGDTYLEYIRHPDDEKQYDTFIAEEKLNKPTVEIPLEQEYNWFLK